MDVVVAVLILAVAIVFVVMVNGVHVGEHGTVIQLEHPTLPRP